MRFTSAGFQPESQRPPGTLIRLTSLDSRIDHPRRILMASKLAISALVIASLLGAPVIASAQIQPPAAGASSEGTAAPGATGTKMKKSSKKSSSKSAMKSKKGAAAPGADSGTGSESK
jgi:hypothetical protein